MPAFRYLAMAGDGSERRGLLEGPHRQWVLEQLGREELLPLEVELDEPTEGAVEAIRKRLPVTTEDLSLFSSQFALMLETGLPILSALDLLAENSPKLKLSRALHQAREAIGGGTTLSEALAETGQFPSVYTDMVRAGETGGTLGEVLSQLSAYLDREAELRGKVKKALGYPAFLLLLAVGVVTFLVVAIIPRFAEILGRYGAELPLPTRMLLATSAFMVKWWPVVLGGVALLAVGAWVLGRDEAFRARLDRALLGAPLLGELIAKNSLSRFCYVLSSLLAAGIPIVEGMRVARDITGNRELKRSLDEARKEIMGGRSISEALGGTGGMPRLVIQMVSIGESTGSLDQVLGRVAEIYDQQVDRATRTLVAMIEPALILVLGGVVGFVALSMVLPMVKAVSSIGG